MYITSSFRTLLMLFLLALLASGFFWEMVIATSYLNKEDANAYVGNLDVGSDSLPIIAVLESPWEVGKDSPGRLSLYWGNRDSDETTLPPNLKPLYILVSEKNKGPGQTYNLYDPKRVQFMDIDGDGIREILSWWWSGPGNYYGISLVITKYVTKIKEFISRTPHNRYSSESLFVSCFGGLYLEQLDEDSNVEIVSYAPITRRDQRSGLVETLWGAHRLKLSVYEFSDGRIQPDHEWNKGQTIITEIKYATEPSEDLKKVKEIINKYTHNPLYNPHVEGDPSGIFLISPETKEVGLPISLLGEVDINVGALLVEVTDESGTVLLVDKLELVNKEPGRGARFEEDIYYNEPNTRKGFINFYRFNSDRHVPNHLIANIPIKFKILETENVKLYFPNSKLNEVIPQTAAQVYPVHRRVPKSDDILRKTLDLLLAGPTFSEVLQGYWTGLPPTYVEICHLGVENNLAEVCLFNTGWDALYLERTDWKPTCEDKLVDAEQIRRTLLQYPHIARTEIYITGCGYPYPPMQQPGGP